MKPVPIERAAGVGPPGPRGIGASRAEEAPEEFRHFHVVGHLPALRPPRPPTLASTLTTAGPTWSTRSVKSGNPTTICGAGAGDCAVATENTTADVATAVVSDQGDGA